MIEKNKFVVNSDNLNGRQNETIHEQCCQNFHERDKKPGNENLEKIIWSDEDE